MADSQRIVRVKTRTKAFFFEEILINIPSENLPKLSKGRMQYFSCPEAKLKEPTLNRKCKQLFNEQVARTKDDHKFSTAKDPLFNSTGFCMVEDHCRQEHRCDCLCTDRSLSMLEQRLKRAVQKAYLDYSRREKKEMFFKSHTGEQGTSLYSVHVSQKGRCTWHSWLNYKVITLNCKHAPPDARRPNKFQKEAAQQVSPCKPLPFRIFFSSWVVSI